MTGVLQRNIAVLAVLAAAGAAGLAGCETSVGVSYDRSGYTGSPTPYYQYYGTGPDDYYGPGLYVDPYPPPWPEGFWRDFDRHRSHDRDRDARGHRSRGGDDRRERGRDRDGEHHRR